MRKPFRQQQVDNKFKSLQDFDTISYAVFGIIFLLTIIIIIYAIK